MENGLSPEERAEIKRISASLRAVPLLLIEASEKIKKIESKLERINEKLDKLQDIKGKLNEIEYHIEKIRGGK